MTELHPEGHPAYIGLPTYLQAPFARDADELRASGADVAVFGAPVDMGTTNRSGARMGPRAIRQAAYFGMASTCLYHIGLDVEPLDHVKVVDFGDANCPPSSLELSHEAVRTKAREALDAGTIPIVLGGDHSITLPSA
ncbi:MAG: arginase family protein, partial [Chloroflexota bacterium]